MLRPTALAVLASCATAFVPPVREHLPGLQPLNAALSAKEKAEQVWQKIEKAIVEKNIRGKAEDRLHSPVYTRSRGVCCGSGILASLRSPVCMKACCRMTHDGPLR